jgi:hypothetical protein
MIKSETTSPQLLQRIDELLISHHPFLKLDDEVYYCGEYANKKIVGFLLRAQFNVLKALYATVLIEASVY